MKKILKWCLPLMLLTFCAVGLQALQVEAKESTLAPANPDSTTKWEETPYETDTAESTTKSGKMSISSEKDPVITDISHHQGTINWAKASKVIDLAIIRTQYGSQLEDRKHLSYEADAKKYKVPFGVYAYNLATDVADAKVEARNFYKRASKDAAFYVIDVEEFTGTSNASMRGIVDSYIAELRKLTDKKIGLYIANHMYSSLNLNVAKADFVWIPRYSSIKPEFTHKLWQYTDKGKIDGISTYVDLNKLASGVSLDYFTGKTTEPEPEPEPEDTYYETNPKQIATTKNIYEYSSTVFNDSTLVDRVVKNTVLKVTDIEVNPSGIPRLKLENGNYITANKQFVTKTIGTIDNYFTKVPKKVMLMSNQTAYKKTNFVAANKVARYSKNTIFTIADIDYTASGTPRLKTISGYYITANKEHIRSVVSGILNYMYINPQKVVTKSKVNVYTTVGFGEKTGKSYAKGKTITVQGISWTASGTPRLKIGEDQYISANLGLVKKK